MTNEAAAALDLDLLVLTLVAGMALFLVYSLWQATCIAWMRQLCFEARDAIFDLVADGKLDFASPDYREIRSGIETLIRFAERISWPRLLCYYLSVRPGRRVSAISAAVERVSDPEARQAIRREMHKVNRAVWFLLVLRSPVFILLCVVMAGARWITSGVDDLRRRVLEGIKIEAEESRGLIDHVSSPPSGLQSA